MKENNKTSVFSLIISIISLAFVTIGTTFSFFTSVIKNTGEELKVETANFKLAVDVTPLYNSKKIIPTNDTDIIKAFNNECVDDNEYGACYAYNIKINSEGDPQDVIGNFKTVRDGIDNLKYMILDADNKDENGNYLIYKEPDFTKLEYEKIGKPIHLEGKEKNTTRNLILVIWLSNTGKIQDEESNKFFTGYFTVNSTLGSKITGSLTASVDNS